MKEIKIDSLNEIPDGFTGIVKNRNFYKFWFQNGKLHREDGPAIKYFNGATRWYRFGELHRFKGPAVTTTTGSKIWYQNGKRHRLDGPAVKYPSGNSEYWIGGSQYSKEKFFKKTKLIQQQFPKRYTEYKHLSDEQWYEYLNVLVVE